MHLLKLSISIFYHISRDNARANVTKNEKMLAKTDIFILTLIYKWILGHTSMPRPGRRILFL